MPLIYKPRDPTFGQKKVKKRSVIRRKPIHASVLPETKAFIESQRDTMSPGHLIDAAIKLYAEHRGLSEMHRSVKEVAKLEALSTTISQDTLAYIRYMHGAMTPGELVDLSIQLYKELKE
jgi:hypothetical protein